MRASGYWQVLATIAAGAAISAALLYPSRWQMSGNFLLDRWTGEVSYCEAPYGKVRCGQEPPQAYVAPEPTTCTEGSVVDQIKCRVEERKKKQGDKSP